MSRTTTSRRIYIDHDAANEGIVLRRVPVTHTIRSNDAPQRPQSQPQSAALLFGLGRLVRGRMVRRII